MAGLPQAFDSNQHDIMDKFAPIPTDWYNMRIVKTDVVKTKKKDGHYISLEFEVMEGDFKGRKVWTNLNVDNPNPVAVEIANKDLARICLSCGIPVIQDTQELHDIPLRVKVGLAKTNDQYPEPKNEPKNYEPINGWPDDKGSKNSETPKKTGVPWK